MGPNRKSRLIVLNGASSAGKTSVAEALRDLLGPGCVHTGPDLVLGRLQSYGPEPRGPLGHARRLLRCLVFRVTGGRARVFAGLHREAAALVGAGHDVVVDTAFVELRDVWNAARHFAPVGGLFVGMHPPLAVSERWEVARGDRRPGLARRSYVRAHAHGLYDMVVDPSDLTPRECALAILKRLETGPSPEAFRTLAARGRGRT